MYRYRLLLLFLFIAISLKSIAQQPVQIHITEKEGLPDKELYNVAEDSKGFIWLAGNKGLTRFDGTTFLTLEHPEKRGLSLFQLKVDEQDIVWCVNISGQLFYSDGNELQLYADLKDDLKGSLAELHVTSKYVMLLTNFTIIIFDRNTGKRTTIPMDTQSFSYQTVINDEIYFLLENTLFKVTATGLKEEYDIGLKLQNTKTQRTGAVKLTRIDDNTLLLYASNEWLEIILYSISKTGITKIEVPKQLEKKLIVSIKKIGDAFWWLTDKGAFAFTLKGDTLNVKSHILPAKFVTDVSRDREDNFLITTLRDGLYILPNLSIKASYFPKIDGLVTRMIRGAGDDIILGFSNGDVVIYNIVSNEHVKVDLPDDRPISSILYNKKKEQYWYFQDIKTYGARVAAPSEYSLLPIKKVSVKSIEALSDNRYAFANSGEVAIGGQQSLIDIVSSENTDFFIQKRGYKVLQSKDESLTYFASVDELIAVDDLLAKTVIKSKDGKPILGQSLTQTDDGHLWVATFTQGVYEIKGTTVVNHYTINDGLLSNRTTVVAPQGNNVWVGTDEGLQLLECLSKDEKRFKTLNKQDGILSYDIKDIVIDGASVFVAFAEGIFQIDTEHVFKTFDPARLYVTDVTVNSVRQPLKSHYEMQQDASDFMMRFNVNGLRGLSSGLFKYRLSGYTDTWTDLRPGDNEVQYASLPRGKFVFELVPQKVSSDVGNVIAIALEVTVPFYKTIWFYSLVGLVGLLGIILYYKRLLNRTEQQRIKEGEQLQLANQLTALKLENLQSQMNPHFIFNALNSIQEYIVHNEKDLASSYLVKFSRLIRMYLDHSRESTVALAEELEAMKLYLQLEKIRFEDKLLFEIICAPSLNTLKIEVPPLFIQPYVENALKHGLLHRKNDRKLKVEFTYNDDDEVLNVIVQDNGVGRVATQAIKDAHPEYHRSFATDANNRRVDLLNKNRAKKIQVTTEDLYENNVASGTRIIIKIPN